MRTGRLLNCFIAATVVAAVLLGRWGAGQKRERIRLEANQSALLEREREYIIRDSLNAVSIGVLTLKAADFERHFADMKAMAQDMGVRIKRIENISRNALKSDYEILTPVRDTIVVIDSTQAVKGLSLAYRDPWIELDGTIIENMFKGRITTYDTLTQVVHRVPKRFLFLKFGTKELRQEIVSSNPNTRLTYNQSINIIK